MSDEEFKELKQIVAVAKSDLAEFEYRLDSGDDCIDGEYYVQMGINQTLDKLESFINDVEKLIKNVEQGKMFSQKREPSKKQIPLI